MEYDAEQFVILEKTSDDTLHDIIFCIKQSNVQQLFDSLENISDPYSPNYGHYLTSDQINQLIRNYDSSMYVINRMEDLNVKIIHKTNALEYIVARGKISIWESYFNAKFYNIQNLQTMEVHIRALEYSLPEDLVDHIGYVFNMRHIFPTVTSSITPIAENIHSDIDFDDNSYAYITPKKIINYYNIKYNSTKNDTDYNIKSSQTIFESDSEYLSLNDLEYFENYFDLPPARVNIKFDHVENNKCINSPVNCVESNTILQYITGVETMSYMNSKFQYVKSADDHIETTYQYVLIN